jgi:hypothetical protein
MKRFLCVLLVLGLSPLLLSYVIYLKDGSTYMAKTNYRVENGKALITLMNGTLIAVDLAAIDTARTASANKAGLDADGVLPSVGSSTVISDAPARPTLSSIAKGSGALSAPKANSTGAPRSSPAAAEHKDREPEFSDDSVRRAFGKIFENVNLFEYRIVQGTAPDAVRILMTTDNEKDIFNALTASAKVMAELNDLGKTNAARLELFMTTTSGAAAGRFSITLEAARNLAQGKVSVEQFFVDQVIF